MSRALSCGCTLAVLFSLLSACGEAEVVEEHAPAQGCAGVACGPNAYCNISSGTAVCVCERGYQDRDGDGDCDLGCEAAQLACGANAACSDAGGAPACACNSGFQDHDGDGDCAPSCAGVVCGQNAACSDASGVAACACNTGHQDNDGDGDCAPSCAASSCGTSASCSDASGAAVCRCDAGYQDEDGDGNCSEDCILAGLVCGANADCSDATGTAACTCHDDTFDPDGDGDCWYDCDTRCLLHASACDDSSGRAVCTCEAGYQDNDGNGFCSTTCASAGCGANTTCSDASGTATCLCTLGNQDNDGDKSCSPSCATAGCGANTTCSDASGTALCACIAGHQDNDGDGDCSPSCVGSPLSCGHGACDDASGERECLCNFGWSGAACDTASCAGIDCYGNGTCAVTGSGGACTCTSGYLGQACEYRLVYGVDLPTNAQWYTSASVPYSVDNSAETFAFDRIAYRLELDGAWVLASMDAFSFERSLIGVPADVVWDQSVSRLTVETNSSAVVPVTDSPTGKVELWSSCYNTSPTNRYDHDDTPDGPDCYGSLQVHDGTTTVLAYDAWASGETDGIGLGNNPNGEPDWTFAQNAGSYTTRRLEVFVREVPTCSASACSGHGTCDDTSGAAVCTCSAGYTGTRCTLCAPGYNDLDRDGSCQADCGGGTCTGLDELRSLSTGLHTITLQSGPAQVYIDGSYDAGGWILIGRGRQGWDWTNSGRGSVATVRTGLGTAAAFAPAYFASPIVQGLIDANGFPIDLDDVEIRLRRAANAAGTSYQEVRWTISGVAGWDWLFPNGMSVLHEVASSALGAGALLSSGNTSDVGPNDHRRVFTWAWDGHNYQQGFSYGSTVSLGSNNPTNFLWQYGFENHSIPYTEVYARVRRCTATLCGPNGTCSDAAGLPSCTCSTGYTGPACQLCDTGYQDNDENGSCSPACSAGTCTSPGEYCSDLGGTAQCLTSSGQPSCLAILTATPGAASGAYVIDPDGAGGNAPFAVYCDMTSDGGGWTQIALDTFNDGLATGWSTSQVDTTTDCAVTYSPMLGGYTYFGNGAQASRTYDLLGVTHTQARASLSFVVIDSWDGELGIMRLDGNTVVATSVSGGTQVCGHAGFGDRGPQAMTSTIAHSTGTLTVQVTSTLNQDPWDESWGADDVRVMVR